MKKILILGSEGMLGNTVVKFLSKRNFKVSESNRSGKPIVSGNEIFRFDILKDNSKDFIDSLPFFDYVINCTGLIKHKINENMSSSILSAFRVNSIFPFELALHFQKRSRIIQIGTDCVYDGKIGLYSELSEKTETDIYGVSKREGEVQNDNFMIIRCSVIGLELASKLELLSWFLNSPKGHTVKGFTNHLWNGVTTLDFAKVIGGVIQEDNFSAGTHHLVPRDDKSKFELLNLVAQFFDREDIQIIPEEASTAINRTLTTINSKVNGDFWEAAGYSRPPSIADMISSYSSWLRGSL